MTNDKAKLAVLDSAVYRRENLDLAHLSDDELKRHFLMHGWRERRTYASTASSAETLSMRWLRGRGLEIGAGRYPTPSYGETRVEYAETDPSFAFGGSGAVHRLSIEDALPPKLKGQFDFVVASHVLEHCDSLIRAVENMAALINERGIIYIILPDKRFLNDQNWLPDFDLDHHLTEWKSPLAFSKLHDEQFCSGITTDIRLISTASVSDAFALGVTARNIPQEHRFMTHKHNYRFGDWVSLLLSILPLVDKRLILEDCAFGGERKDCHFIVTRR